MEKQPPPSNIVFLAETNFRNQKRRFGIKRDDRRRHMYLIGKTGMGKSTAMENMIIQDIMNGDGVALVDPHGDFAEKILDYIPSYRINDVIYFNPADIDYPIAFNIMEANNHEHKHLIASGMVGVFKKLWADSWGPRLEYVLRNAILALLDYPGSTLLGVMRILADKNYRKKVVAKVTDPVVRSFWLEEYAKYPPQLQAEAIAPIQNKVGQFLSTALIRNVVGQVQSTLDLRKIMDEKKVLIMNLSKGRIGEDASALLGAMMITKIQLAAMSRVDTPEHERQDFYLYVDEFQNFATESFANILSEARKYRLNLTIAHQYIEQLDEKVSAAVFGNVGTMMCFRVGAADAEFLLKEFEPHLTAEDLVNLTKFDVYMKLMIDGVSSTPFSATTLGPMMVAKMTDSREKIVKVTRERYCFPRDVVEDKISRWSSSGGDDEAEGAESVDLSNQSTAPTNNTAPSTEPTVMQAQSVAPTAKGFKANCYECGKLTEITFKPDGIRPIYCADCFRKTRQKIVEGKIDQSELNEVVEVPTETISLQALQKPPVMFKQVPASKKAPGDTRPDNEQTKTASPRRDVRRQNTQHRPSNKQPSTTTQPKRQRPPQPPLTPSTPNETPEQANQPSITLQNLQPGQVVKFKN